MFFCIYTNNDAVTDYHPLQGVGNLKSKDPFQKPVSLGDFNLVHFPTLKLYLHFKSWQAVLQHKNTCRTYLGHIGHSNTNRNGTNC